MQGTLTRSRGLRAAPLAALTCLVLALTGCAAVDQAAHPAERSHRGMRAKPARHPRHRAHKHVVPARRHPRSGTASAQLEKLRVAGRAPMSGYDRDRFGYAWLDADRNGCDTRNDMLRRDLHAVTIEPGTQGCVVRSGVLDDPYTGMRIDFVRGDSVSVDIDHVVSLGNAWVSGAWRLDIQERAALANDPLDLLAVDASANRRKGDSNAASWLPPNKAYRCTYVARQIAVKAKYRLAVTSSEKAQMSLQLAGCPGQPAASDVWRMPTRVDQNITDPGAPARSHQTRSLLGGSGSGGGSVYYQNCDAARAAGAAPVHRGDPGYGPHLDRDGDGVGCE